MSKHLTIGEASKRAGISRRTVLNWRTADPEFDRLIFEAQEPIYDQLETTGLERALNEPDKDGKKPFDERTAFLYWVAMLKARRHVYRDSHKASEVTGEIKFTFQLPQPDGFKALHSLPEHVIEGEVISSD